MPAPPVRGRVDHITSGSPSRRPRLPRSLPWRVAPTSPGPREGCITLKFSHRKLVVKRKQSIQQHKNNNIMQNMVNIEQKERKKNSRAPAAQKMHDARFVLIDKRIHSCKQCKRIPSNTFTHPPPIAGPQPPLLLSVRSLSTALRVRRARCRRVLPAESRPDRSARSLRSPPCRALVADAVVVIAPRIAHPGCLLVATAPKVGHRSDLGLPARHYPDRPRLLEPPRRTSEGGSR